jgi:hypothetical protein
MPQKVFISYSHDSEGHKGRVRSLVDRLIHDGVDCILDQYEPHPPAGWPQWMDQQLDDADFVLVICTEGYYTKAKAGKAATSSRGAKFESVLIMQDLYDERMLNDIFIPVLFEDLPNKLILRPLRGYTRYRVDQQSGYEDLLRHLTQQPRLIRPEIGPVATLPPESSPSDLAPLSRVDDILAAQEIGDSRQQFDFRLYDRRMAAYKKVIAYLHKVTFDHAVDLGALRQFADDMQEARFLFDERIYIYLDTIYRSAVELRSVRDRRNTARTFTGPQLRRLSDDDEKLFQYLNAQIGEAPRIFRSYLSLSNY